MDEKNQKTLPAWMMDHLEYIWFVCIGFSIIYTFCRYQNSYGITFPISILAIYMAAYIIMIKLNVVIKKGFYFYMLVSFLLGIITFRTGDRQIHFFNNVAINLLACICVIHQRYQDSQWNIGKYFASILQYIFHSIASIGYSFSNGFLFLKKIQKQKYKTLVLVIFGMIISIPFLTILIALLSKVDAVFGSLMNQVLNTFLRPQTMISITLRIIATTMVIYAFVCGAGIKNIKEEQKDKRSGEPILMITCMGMISVVYLLFSAIQIFYLFMGKGALPENMSYSEYAREGFFQLLFVVFINLVMVLSCLKYFKNSNLLNLVLTVISVCTYVMIASAAYRMMLYIQENQLTLLRVLVLWFLALVTILMIGVVIVIYKNKFPLFHYSVVVVSIFYLGYGWMKPDYIIAKYNVTHDEVITYYDMQYLTNELSVDAIPALLELDNNKLLDNEWGDKEKEQYINKKCYNYDQGSWRKYNLSYGKALQIKNSFR